MKRLVAVIFLWASAVSCTTYPRSDAADPRPEVSFAVAGTALIANKVVITQFERTTSASIPRGIRWSQVPHEATVRAWCRAQKDRKLLGCSLQDVEPPTLANSRIFPELLRKLRLTQAGAAPFGDAPGDAPLQVNILMRNPQGTNKDESFCFVPWCGRIRLPSPVAPERR
jgi:hypothetical protein